MSIPSALRSWAFVACALCASSVSAGESATLDAVRKANTNLSALKAEFSQKNRMKLFKQELTSTGVLYFRPPRQVRWEYRKPDPSTMILDGKTATLSMPGQPTQIFDLDKDATMRAVFDQIAMWLSPSAAGDIDKHYAVREVPGKTPGILLTPHDTSPVARAFSRIELRFDAATWLLSSILLVEKNADEKEILFSKVTRNGPLPEGAFKP